MPSSGDGDHGAPGPHEEEGGVKRRAIVEIANAAQDLGKTCWIETTASGKINFGVKITDRSLRSARLKAQQEFDELRLHILEVEAQTLRKRLEKSQ